MCFSLCEQIGTSPANTILQGDCLQACAYLDSQGQKVDCVYIDTPFASSSIYRRPIYLRPLPGCSQPPSAKLVPAWQQTVFSDDYSRQEFLQWLEPNLRAIHSVLSEHGSLFLHLDHHISHYVKIMLDDIFGADNFRNEIIWSYKTGGVSKRTFAQKHDTIFFYSKSANYLFHPQYYRSYQAKRYNYNPKYPELWDEEVKRWYHLAVCRDVWDDIHVIGTERDGSERLDYPTQKPEALLERLIAATTDENSLVADFFGGSGVCAATAHRLGRRFFHSDISAFSINTCRDRLKLRGADFSLLRPEPSPSDPEIEIEAELLDSNALARCGEQLTLEGDDNSLAPQLLRLKRYKSPQLLAEIAEINDKRQHRGKQKPIVVAPSGLDMVEWLSVDCHSSEGCWHSDSEMYIDGHGRAWHNSAEIAWQGALPCYSRPYRLKVRDISGRETIAVLRPD